MGVPSQWRPAPKGRWPPPKKKVYNRKWYKSERRGGLPTRKNYPHPVPATPTGPLSPLKELIKSHSLLSFISEPALDAESPPENKRKGHLVSGAFISPYMQGVSECESVVFLGRRPPSAGGGPMLRRRPARRAGRRPKHLSTFGISLLNRPT